MTRKKRFPSKAQRDQARRAKARNSIERADDLWLADGGLDRPHTAIGVATARRLLARHPADNERHWTYIRSAPDRMPASDYVAEHGDSALKRKESPQAKTLVRRVVSGGAPSLGKRR
ncbi:hypothetical protein F4692_000748 [Nocardioides cavernae]|uniref:Uncharacterized protein n=1 Tax=Nocardioides cavernae TaxID=1921566 RepID=A0A7Y9H0B4_9ACTN|nr:hypothetical protein [Nocardioides cavernae]NYE35644.1 hypothetical protein [Nocardioides cavernae]